jgi:peptidoglycan hydrolase-like protein with peptidoglycan-binding domain
VLVVVAVVVSAVVVLVVSGVFSSGSGPGGGSSGNGLPTGVARVTRQSLSQQTQVSATLTYAGTATIVAPAGTSPANLLQAQQQATTAEGMLRSAEATLSADSATVSEVEASLAAARGKETVDCAGTNAAQSPSSSPSSGGSASAGCGGDAQTVASDTQSLTQDHAKVTADRSQLSSAESSLAGAQASLTASGSSAALYGQDSTYTSLPAVGAVVGRGESLYSIGGQPVFLLYGQVAAWRAFTARMSSGRDVAELNANLDALGYGKGLSGDSFTPATAAAIEAFQSAHGASATGELLLGSLVFEPGAVRVTAVTPTRGATVQPGPVLTVTLTTRVVQIALDASLQADVKVGDPVMITLPNNQTTPGRVSYVGTVATVPPSSGGGGGGSSTPTIAVDVTPTDPAATGHLDQAPVNVSITTASVSNVLVVPVDALLALSSGGYAVEETGAGGTHQLVAVTTGLFDDAEGVVQVSGNGLAVGQRVVVPGQ